LSAPIWIARRWTQRAPNAEANSVFARYHCSAALLPGTFDVVLANILANPLLLLAPVLIARVRKGGALVLSGVLARQADEVVAAYAGRRAGAASRALAPRRRLGVLAGGATLRFAAADR